MRQPNLHFWTSRIVGLAQSGMIDSARQLFDSIPQRDVITWNAMLSAYSRSGHSREALCLFSDMRMSGFQCDPYSFTAAVSACADLCEHNYGRKLHGLIVSLGFLSSFPVCNSLIDMYGKLFEPLLSLDIFRQMEEINYVSWCSLLSSWIRSGLLEEAHTLFEKMPQRTAVAWNAMIAGYARHGDASKCVSFFREMKRTGETPELSTFLSLMSLCGDAQHACYGLMVHACIVKCGLLMMVEVTNSVLSFYAKFDFMEEATKLFESMDCRTQVSWNAMIDAHMRHTNVKKAFSLFEMAPERNQVSWTTMIAGCTRNGHSELSLNLFVGMYASRLLPDDFTFGSVLHACASLALLEHGKMVHACIICMGFSSYIYVANGLIDMYAKCGDLLESHQVFCSTLNKDEVSWNAMIFGFGQHGKVVEVLKFFEAMVESKIRPDKVTFLGLLMACSHCGLVKQGRFYFETMIHVYGIMPEADHIACMVDILGRAGFLEEACSVAKSSMCSKGADSTEALLGSCVLHGNVELANRLAGELLVTEANKDIGYVLLSNLYCGVGGWKEAQRVRKEMVKQGVRKPPGCSWIEAKNSVQVFVAGDTSHHKNDAIFEVVHSLGIQIRSSSCVYCSEDSVRSKYKL